MNPSPSYFETWTAIQKEKADQPWTVARLKGTQKITLDYFRYLKSVNVVEVDHKILKMDPTWIKELVLGWKAKEIDDVMLYGVKFWVEMSKEEGSYIVEWLNPASRLYSSDQQECLLQWWFEWAILVGSHSEYMAVFKEKWEEAREYWQNKGCRFANATQEMLDGLQIMMQRRLLNQREQDGLDRVLSFLKSFRIHPLSGGFVSNSSIWNRGLPDWKKQEWRAWQVLEHSRWSKELKNRWSSGSRAWGGERLISPDAAENEVWLLSNIWEKKKIEESDNVEQLAKDVGVLELDQVWRSFSFYSSLSFKEWSKAIEKWQPDVEKRKNLLESMFNRLMEEMKDKNKILWKDPEVIRRSKISGLDLKKIKKALKVDPVWCWEVSQWLKRNDLELPRAEWLSPLQNNDVIVDILKDLENQKKKIVYQWDQITDQEWWLSEGEGRKQSGIKKEDRKEWLKWVLWCFAALRTDVNPEILLNLNALGVYLSPDWFRPSKEWRRAGEPGCFSPDWLQKYRSHAFVPEKEFNERWSCRHCFSNELFKIQAAMEGVGPCHQLIDIESSTVYKSFRQLTWMLVTEDWEDWEEVVVRDNYEEDEKYLWLGDLVSQQRKGSSWYDALEKIQNQIKEKQLHERLFKTKAQEKTKKRL